MEGETGDNQNDHRSGRERRRAFLDRFHKDKYTFEGDGAQDPEHRDVAGQATGMKDLPGHNARNLDLTAVDSQEIIQPHSTAEFPAGDEETAAERKRREAALGIRQNEESDSDDDDTPRLHHEAPRARSRTPDIRFSNVEKREGVEVEISRPPSMGLMSTPNLLTLALSTEEGGNGEAMARNTSLQWSGDVKGKQKES